MARVDDHLQEIREAIKQLQDASEHTHDQARARVARQLESEFAQVESPHEVRQLSETSLQLYRGGMGSFQDVGSEVMWNAVERLRLALRRAAR